MWSCKEIHYYSEVVVLQLLAVRIISDCSYYKPQGIIECPFLHFRVYIFFEEESMVQADR